MASDAFQKWWSAFKANGDICPLRLGSSREQVRAVLGEPDAVSGTSRKHRTPAILRYKELEFHFGPQPEENLSLIYMEDKNGMVRISIPRLS